MATGGNPRVPKAQGMTMKVLVTGASGLIGRHVLRHLTERGCDVTAVSRGAIEEVGLRVLQQDLLAPTAPALIFDQIQPDILIHLAWCTQHGQFWRSPQNLDWLARSCDLASSAAQVGVKRIIMAGTCFEYEFPSDGDCIERVTPLANHFPYDAAKDACRRACAAVLKQQGVSFSWARLFHLYGPHEHPDRLVASVARSLVAGQPALCSSGTVLRDYMHVSDAGAGIAALALSPVDGEVNIATGKAVSVAEIATTLGELASLPQLVRLGALPDRADDPPRIVASVRRLIDEVGFRPRYTLQDGLAETLDWWRHQV